LILEDLRKWKDGFNGEADIAEESDVGRRLGDEW
jgi:hypothetical protein